MTKRSPRPPSAIVIAVAAAIAGALAFVLTFVVARSIGAAAAAGFTAFWSATYLIVGALSGIQQEITRATHPASPDHHDASALRKFVLVAAGVVLVVAAGIGALWAVPLFGPETGWAIIVPLAVGPAGYVVVTAIGGTLYGVRRWRLIAAMIIGDSVLRLLAVGVVLLFTTDIVALAWAIALPFGGTALILWPFARRRLVGKISVDVPMPRLSTNAAKAVVGSLATAILVSGLPLLIVATSPDISVAQLGAFVFALTIVRAPVMVGISSLQSLFVVRFRDNDHPLRTAGVLIGTVGVVGVIFTAVVAAFGDPVLTTLIGPDFAVGGARLLVIAASSVLLGMLFVTGPLLVARGRHTVFAIGWAVAAAVSVASLLLPLPFDVRATIALLAGPLAGVLIHLGGALWRRDEL